MSTEVGALHAGLTSILVQRTTQAPETIITHFDWFAWGMLLASFAVDREPLEGRSRLLVGAWLLAAFVFLLDSSATAEGLVAALLVGSVALLAPVPVSQAGLGTRLVLWLGLISYGIFLWHDPIIDGLAREGLDSWLLVPATLSLTVAVAAASYYFLERPILRAAHRYRTASPLPSSDGLGDGVEARLNRT